eukprot:gene17950-16992_t
MSSHNRPVKMLGKVYVDRNPGMRPQQSLLYQAVKVIKTKAPTKHKTQVAFMTTQSAVKAGRLFPAALIGQAHDGTIVLKFPLLTIISIGHTGKNFVFVSVEPHTDEKMRFWIHAFACKSSDHAAATAAKLIAACSGARKAFTDAKASGGQVRMGADPNESNAAYLLGQDIDFSVLEDQSDRGSVAGETTMGPIDLSMCLKEAQASVNGNENVRPAGGVHDLDLDLSTSVLEEMYDLDCALQDFELPAELRGKLLDSWQRGFSTASSENVSFTAAEPRIPLTATV